MHVHNMHINVHAYMYVQHAYNMHIHNMHNVTCPHTTCQHIFIHSHTSLGLDAQYQRCVAVNKNVLARCVWTCYIMHVVNMHIMDVHVHVVHTCMHVHLYASLL